MGRSRGGLTTKIHALVDANGLPIVLKLTAGQAHDGRSAADIRPAVMEPTLKEAASVVQPDPSRARERVGGCHQSVIDLQRGRLRTVLLRRTPGAAPAL